MRMRHLLWSVAAVSLGAGYLFGQSRSAQQPTFWYITEYRVPFAMADSLQRLIRIHTLPANEEARRSGDFLGERWLFHHTGGAHTVLRMRQFRTWDAIENDTSVRTAFRRQVPDSARRAAINAAFAGILLREPHRDAIYVEPVY